MSTNYQLSVDQHQPAAVVYDVLLGNSSVATTPPDDTPGIKSFPPTPTKKAWRKRLQMDGLVEHQSTADLGLLTPSTPNLVALQTNMATDISGKVLSSLMDIAGKPDQVGESSAGQCNSLSGSPTRFFACGQCGKCFVSLKYLDMHAAALHAGKSKAGCDVIVVEPAAMASIVSAALGGVIPGGAFPLAVHPSLTNMSSVDGSLERTGSTAADLEAVKQASTVVAELQQPSPVLLPVSTAAAPAVASPGFGRSAAALSAATVSTARHARNNEWKCETCHKTFSQNSSYKNHQRTHSDERPFVCNVCSIGFKERYHLKKHVLFKHTDELREACRICGKRFKDTTAVRAHERIHSDQRPYSCQRCNKAFKTSECLWHHENRSKSCGGGPASVAPAGSFSGSRAGGSKRFRRDVTPSVPAVEYAAVDRRLQNSSVTVQAQWTQTGVVGAAELAQEEASAASNDDVMHVMMDELHTAAVVDVIASSSEETNSAHGQSSPEVLPVRLTEPKAQPVKSESSSTECGEAVSTHRDGLVLLADCAARAPDPERMPSKLDCAMPFQQSPTLPTSQLLQVKVEPEVVLADYELTAMTSSESSFYERIREMASEAEMQNSDDASKASSSSTDSSQKSNNDAGRPSSEAVAPPRRLECNRCGRQFSTVRAYDKHIIVHSEARPYLCDKCDVGFKLKVHLKKHILYRHSDDYHCSCRHCGKKFKDSSAVRLHERIHSTDRPFACGSCGKTFKTRENLWGHRHRGPCGLPASAPQQQSQTAATSQSSDIPEAVVQAVPSVTDRRQLPIPVCAQILPVLPATLDGVTLITARPDSIWPSSVNPPALLTDDWIAKLITATAASRRSAHDVTQQTNEMSSNVTSAASTSATAVGCVASQTETTVMTVAEQEALLLNKAILLSRLIQSQCSATGRQLFATSAGTPTTLLSGVGNGLPTAVVAPIKRQTTETEHVASNVASVDNMAASTGVNASSSSMSEPSIGSSSSQLQQPAASPMQFPASTGKAHLPPIETFRAYHSAIVDALSRNEAAQTEVNTSPFGPAAVNLTLHASANSAPAGDGWLETGNKQASS